MRVSEGNPDSLGATPDKSGTNFALFSAHAESVVLCLFDAGGRENARILLPEKTGDIWHGHVGDVKPGQHYGYRILGPYEPLRGHRFNANKLLLDPYAREISGQLVLKDLHFAYRLGDPESDLSFDRRDNNHVMIKSVVTRESSPQPSRMPRTAWEDTIIYEAHVKGLTQLHPDVPPHWRGKFRSLSSPAIVSHLKKLGVTAIELLPVHAFIDDWFVRQRGLHNYWGYNSVSYFAPDARYSIGAPSKEFRETVDRLHDAGIEIILDVVYNHSCEGDHLGPTLSFRGIDNASYYRLRSDAPRFYEDVTGCGNALNFGHPKVIELALSSLRYWAETFDIDGFRFDLAVTLARDARDFDPNAPFFAAIQNDPILSKRKLIAEPWDLGHEGHRTGGFPRAWSEWNDRFRRGMRRFWLGHETHLGEIAQRMAGSDDLFKTGERCPSAGINFVTAHDGFTLADLVSYERKHNEKNLESNRDGEERNDSTNCGTEGPTADSRIAGRRIQLRKALLASLLFARGVPMLLAGDEAGNSQVGNNNAYCQDNETGWVDWSLLGRDGDLTDFLARLVDLRKRFAQLHAKEWLVGGRSDGSCDVRWFTPMATEMTMGDWNFPNGRFLCFVLGPETRPAPLLLIVLNASRDGIAFQLPDAQDGGQWILQLDTAATENGIGHHSPGAMLVAPAQSVQLYASENAVSRYV